MGERRMFSKTIIDSDNFLDMPLSSQLLYFHLSMRADDDGFINNPKSITRNVRCNDDDLKLLIAKQFIIPFESGVVVIKHWKIHNYIRADRYKETNCLEEKKFLQLNKGNEYVIGIPSDNQVTTIPQPSGNQVVDNRYTQVKLSKVKLSKVKLSKVKLSKVKKELELESTLSCKQDQTVKTVIDYLNERTNQHYKSTTKKTKALIKARMNEGFLVDDFKVVIDKKAYDWLNDPAMVQYLRPETLFGTKFEGYLNQKNAVKKNDKQKAIDVVNDLYDELGEKNGN